MEGRWRSTLKRIIWIWIECLKNESVESGKCGWYWDKNASKKKQYLMVEHEDELTFFYITALS